VLYAVLVVVRRRDTTYRTRTRMDTTLAGDTKFRVFDKDEKISGLDETYKKSCADHCR
jgi:hypothetical protein